MYKICFKDWELAIYVFFGFIDLADVKYKILIGVPLKNFL